ncbi:hypothetical protein [Gilvimarinus polysaccharolyticus]|uniref:hypothetical protein n=1 Tax=Gilvimarinus polysaccharolyticus TaxID=863921 RepID=UPI0006736AB5|nr:hypothetical protein [Gilvimarinus polysaccharolyticus]
MALGVLLVTLCAANAPAAVATTDVDVQQLHLPRSYLRYLPSMLDGARLMAADEQCAQFLAGDLNIDQSTLSHPVFRYQCRDPNGATYRWYIDGDTLEVIDNTRPNGRISFADLAAQYEHERELARQLAAERQAKIDALQRERQEVAEQRQAEQLAREQLEAERQEQARRQRLWQECQTQLAKQTADMIEREWLTLTQPEAEVTETRLRFSVDFNALNLNGVELKYRAYCDAQNPVEPQTPNEAPVNLNGEDGEQLTIEIHPRALVQSTSSSTTSVMSASEPMSVSTSSSSQR